MPRKKQDRKRWGKKCPGCGAVQKTANLCSWCYPIGTHDNVQEPHPVKDSLIARYAVLADNEQPLFGEDRDS